MSSSLPFIPFPLPFARPLISSQKIKKIHLSLDKFDHLFDQWHFLGRSLVRSNHPPIRWLPFSFQVIIFLSQGPWPNSYSLETKDQLPKDGVQLEWYERKDWEWYKARREQTLESKFQGLSIVLDSYTWTLVKLVNLIFVILHETIEQESKKNGQSRHYQLDKKKNQNVR